MRKTPVNPYLPSYEYVPDAEPYVFGDRLYVFGSHDRFGGEDFCEKNYVGWSAPADRLWDWHCHGVIYDRREDPFYRDERTSRLFAPDVQQGADGRYYLYYGFAHEGRIGVAVCSEPAGIYHYYGHVHHADGTLLGEREGDLFQYDPAVLADDDGRVWLYTGFCFNTEKLPKLAGIPENHEGAMVTELEPDMVTVRTEPKIIVPSEFNAAGTGFQGHAFFEAPSIRKKDGRYYFIYSSENSHELCYAVSGRPDGDFAYGGTIISNCDLGYRGNTKPLNYYGTNHGSIVRIGEDWYVFYHRQSGGSPYQRQGCAERIRFAEDGSIPQVQMTSFGLGHPFQAEGTFDASMACCLMSREGAKVYRPKRRIGEEHPFLTQSGEDRESDPDQYIANMRDGARAGFRSFVFSGEHTLQAVYRGDARGELIVTDGMEGSGLLSLPVTESGDWTACEGAFRREGTGELWLTFRGSGSLDLQKLVLHETGKGTGSE